MLRAISIAVFLTAVGGCSSQVTVNNPTIPDPLVEKIPLSVAVRYPPEFEHYVHTEQVIGKEKWTIDLGRSNEFLFTNLFRSMFNDLMVVDSSAQPGDLGVDALIEPSIDAFEFSTPNQSQTQAFAVWIRYRIKIFDKEGEQFANWPISAYGKSQTTMMGGDEALRRAAVLAMRDAAALIVMQMDKTTRISRLGRRPVSSVAASPKPQPPAPTTAEPEEEEPQATVSEDVSDETG
jgi:hypothetical protein